MDNALDELGLYILCGPSSYSKMFAERLDDNLVFAEFVNEISMFESPIDPSVMYYLLYREDNTTKCVERFYDDIHIDLQPYPICNLLLCDIDFNICANKILIPASVRRLNIEGGSFRHLQVDTEIIEQDIYDYGVSTKSLFAEFLNVCHEAANKSGVEYILDFNAEVRSLQCLISENIKVSIVPFLKGLFVQTPIEFLCIGWIFLTSEDLLFISTLNLKQLVLQYISKPSVEYLPSSLKSFTWFGDAVLKMEKLNLAGTYLEELDFSGQGYEELSDLNEYETISSITATEGLIKNFNICDLPPNLSSLFLDSNQISNDCIYKLEGTCESLRILDLRYNYIDVNFRILEKLISVFPYLEELYLLGNTTSGLPNDILCNCDIKGNQVLPPGALEEKYEFAGNCLPAVHRLLSVITIIHPSLPKDFVISRYNDYQVNFSWNYPKIPYKFILNQIQESFAFSFQDYIIAEKMKEVKDFIIYDIGVYIHLRHLNLTLQIEAREGVVDYMVTSKQSSIVSVKVPFYLTKLKSIIEESTYERYLPFFSLFHNGIQIEDKLLADDYLYMLYCRIYDLQPINKKLPIIFPHKKQVLLLVYKVDEKSFFKTMSDNKILNNSYVALDEVVFVVITGKSVCAYRRDENGNIVNQGIYGEYRLVVRESKDKSEYIERVVDAWLPSYQSMELVNIKLRGEKQMMIQVIANKKLTNVKDGKMYLNNNLLWKVDNQQGESEPKKGKVLKLKIENSKDNSAEISLRLSY